MTKVASSVSATEYLAFDILGRVTSHKQTTDSTDYTTSYTYNLSGALLEQIYPSGRVVKNTIDTADGSLSQVQSKRSGETYRNFANGFNYNAAGAVTSMKLGNGLWETTQFNSRLQPTQIGLGLGSATPNKLKLDYSYGTTANNGNVMSQTITVPGVAHLFVQTYTYDELNRISNAEELQNSVQTWEQTFTYDRYGNRNFDEANTTTLPKNCGSSPNFTVCAADKKIVNPGFETNNRLESDDDYTFDSAGNTTADALGRTFVYDAENKQIEVIDNSVTVGEYSYDGDGKRIKKHVPATGELTVFIYDVARKLIEEHSTIVQTGGNAKAVYTTNDHLGSPRINTDATGQVISRHDYHPFGDEVTRSGYGSDTIRKQFTGYERDGETGLDFAQARMYNSTFGRFSVPDPTILSVLANFPGSWNRYMYVMNNPLKYKDPLGLWAIVAAELYEVTYDPDGKEISRKLVGYEVTAYKTKSDDDGKRLAEQLGLRGEEAKSFATSIGSSDNVGLASVANKTVSDTYGKVDSILTEQITARKPDGSFAPGNCAGTAAFFAGFTGASAKSMLIPSEFAEQLSGKNASRLGSNSIDAKELKLNDIAMYKENGEVLHYTSFIFLNDQDKPLVFSKNGDNGPASFGTSTSFEGPRPSNKKVTYGAIDGWYRKK